MGETEGVVLAWRSGAVLFGVVEEVVGSQGSPTCVGGMEDPTAFMTLL